MSNQDLKHQSILLFEAWRKHCLDQGVIPLFVVGVNENGNPTIMADNRVCEDDAFLLLVELVRSFDQAKAERFIYSRSIATIQKL